MSRLRVPVIRGIGDDCAVIRFAANQEAIVTTDFSIEGVHFRREWHPPDSVGHRCLARGLSDIAAMGGKPLAAFLSLALPAHFSQRWVDGFFDGLLKLASRHKVTLAGGDIAESPAGVLADIVALGSVPRGTALLRSTAKPGDRIYVSGQLGGSAAVLAQFLAGKPRISGVANQCHFYPDPRLPIGRILREKAIATAAIDLSDGLSTDLTHLCQESRVGAEIDEALIPLANIANSTVPLTFALNGGEDYELLFTARPRSAVPRRIARVPITHIGRIVPGSGITLLTATGKRQKISPGGWEHLSKSRRAFTRG
jgi:thiamine-monophosphate kinase